jgi:hypothetical protein
MRNYLPWALSGVLLGVFFTAACAREKQPVNQPPYGTYPQQYPPQQYPPQQYPPQQPYPTAQQYPPQQYPPASTAAPPANTGIFGIPIPSGLPFPIPSGLPGFPPPAQLRRGTRGPALREQKRGPLLEAAPTSLGRVFARARTCPARSPPRWAPTARREQKRAAAPSARGAWSGPGANRGAGPLRRRWRGGAGRPCGGAAIVRGRFARRDAEGRDALGRALCLNGRGVGGTPFAV